RTEVERVDLPVARRRRDLREHRGVADPDRLEAARGTSHAHGAGQVPPGDLAAGQRLDDGQVPSPRVPAVRLVAVVVGDERHEAPTGGGRGIVLAGVRRGREALLGAVAVEVDLALP